MSTPIDEGTGGPLAAGWRAYRANQAVCLGALATWALSWVLLEILVVATHTWGTVPNIALHLAYLIFASGLELGFLSMALEVSRGGRVSYSDLFTKLRGAPGFLLAKLCFLILVLAGLALLVAPGVWLGVRYSMFAPHLASGTRGILSAFEASAETVRGRGAVVLGFGLRAVLLNVLGACLLGVGLAITLPTTVLALAILFERLSNPSSAQPN